MDSPVIIVSLGNGVEAVGQHLAVVPMEHFMKVENVPILSVARKKELTAAMNVMNWKSVQKGFISRITMELMPAKLRRCSFINMEKKSSLLCMTGCRGFMISRKRRKYWIPV